MEPSVLEQLRLQEGRLFQNEQLLALYLDAKAVLIEALRDDAEAIAKLSDFDEDTSDLLSHNLRTLAPEGATEYHAKSLYECVKVVAKLLWPSQMLLIARPKVTTLLKGLCRRVVDSPAVKTKAFFTLDPIKQDFVVREAFRRTLVNDCLVVFDGPGGDLSVVGDSNQLQPEEEDDGELESLGDIGPEDSASHIGPAPTKRPVGARSTLGPVQEDEEEGPVVGPPAPTAASVAPSKEAQSNEAPKRAASVAPSVAPPRRAASVAPSVAPSIAPRAVTVTPLPEATSHLSRASGSTATSVMRRPLNVRKIHIENDESGKV